MMNAKCAFLFGVLPLTASLAGHASSAERPNIICFLVDDMGWQDTSVSFFTEQTALNRRFHTPNMERLAQMGVRFTEAYACAVSSPSRCSLMSGMNAARHRVTNWTLRYGKRTDAKSGVIDLPEWNYNGIQPDTVRSERFTRNAMPVTPLPRILRDNGYYTIHCGKAHFGAKDTPGANPLAMGFEVNIGGDANGAPGSYLGTKCFGKGSPQEVKGLEKYYGQDVFLTEVLTQEAIEALKTPLARKQPFYLYMSHYAVHSPYDEDKRFAHKYRGRYDEQLQDALNEKEARYAALVEGMDKSLGDLLDFLQQDPEVAARTIILFMSDNGGQALNNVRQGKANHDQNFPARAGKGSAYLGGVREPMMVYWPGVTRGNTCSAQRVMIEDFFPSILELAGLKNYHTRQQLDGVSFVEALKQPGLQRERPIIWHFPNLWGETQDTDEGYGAYSAILKGNYHLIYTWQTGQVRLYNIRKDIGEQNDLAQQEPAVAKALSAELSDYLRGMQAQRPAWKESGTPCPWPDEAN